MCTLLRQFYFIADDMLGSAFSTKMKRLFGHFQLNMLIVIASLVCVPFGQSVSHNFDNGGLFNFCGFAVSC
jgi:hypothetical protein